MNKNAESFTEYCIAHPEQRFWQALRNWSSFSAIFGWNSQKNECPSDVLDQHEGLRDTFFLV